MHAILAHTVPVERERVLGKPESALVGDLPLTILDRRIEKLLDATAVQADQMIVMGSLIELENRLAGLEMATRENAGLFELGQHPINRCKTDIKVFGKKCTIDILGCQVATAGTMKDVEHLEPRGCHLEACRLEVTHAGHATYDSGMHPSRPDQRP